MDAAAGDRLRGYIEARWPRRRTGERGGGIRGLCRAMNIAPETIYGWFRGDNDPSLGALATLADKLGVKRWEIVAAMDGEAAQADPLAARVERLEAMVDGLVQASPVRRGIAGEAAPRVPQTRTG